MKYYIINFSAGELEKNRLFHYENDLYDVGSNKQCGNGQSLFNVVA